jgi:hypothetical protein
VEYKTLKTKDMACMKCNGGNNIPQSMLPTGNCKCKNEPLCPAGLQIRAEDVIWMSKASVEEFGINESDSLEIMITKIGCAFRALQEEINDKIDV